MKEIKKCPQCNKNIEKINIVSKLKDGKTLITIVCKNCGIYPHIID